MVKAKRDVITPVCPGPSFMLGSKEFATVMGMHPEGVYQLRSRGALSEPDDFVGGDPVWHAWTVHRFAAQTGRPECWAPGVLELAEAHWQLTQGTTVRVRQLGAERDAALAAPVAAAG